MNIIVVSLLVTAVIVMFGVSIQLLKDGIEYRDGFIIFIAVVMIGFLVITTGMITYDKVQMNNSTVTVENVKLEVISKSYSPSYTQVIPNGKTLQ